MGPPKGEDLAGGYVLIYLFVQLFFVYAEAKSSAFALPLDGVGSGPMVAVRTPSLRHFSYIALFLSSFLTVNLFFILAPFRTNFLKNSGIYTFQVGT